MARKLTYEEVKNFIEVESGSGCKLLSGIYVNSKEELLIQCNCGNEFKARFNTFKTMGKRQCNECGYSNIGQMLLKSNEEFINEVYCLVGEDYKFLESYKGAHIKIKCKHNKCGRVYKVKPNSFLNGSRCIACTNIESGIKQRKSNEQFTDEVLKLGNGEYVFLEKYKTSQHPILCRHNKCNKTFKVSPDYFLNFKPRCPHCFNNPNSKYGNMKTDVEFKKEVYNIVGHEYTFLDEYKGCNVKILVKHSECNTKYSVIPSEFLRGAQRCPICAKSSKGEARIAEYLNCCKVEYLPEFTLKDCKNTYPLPFDVAIFSDTKRECLIGLIEYDGLQHFEPIDYFGGVEKFKERQCNDNIKTQYCQENNIPLLRIPYWDFDNIEQILEEWLEKQGMLHKNKTDNFKTA